MCVPNLTQDDMNNQPKKKHEVDNSSEGWPPRKKKARPELTCFGFGYDREFRISDWGREFTTEIEFGLTTIQPWNLPFSLGLPPIRPTFQSPHESNADLAFIFPIPFVSLPYILPHLLNAAAESWTHKSPFLFTPNSHQVWQLTF